MKKIITAIIILAVLSVSIVIMKKYTDIFGAPEYILTDDYPVYIFEKVDEVEELSDPPEYTLKYLKYCDKLKRLTISFASYDNLDFMSDLEITDFYIMAQCRDWSKISTLTHLNSLTIHHSDFGDVSLLRSMSELEDLFLDCRGTVDISRIGELPKLNKLYINVQNDDISDISGCTQLTALNICGCKNVTDISFLKDMDNIEKLWFGGHNIEDISFLKDMDNIKELYLGSLSIEDYSFLKDMDNIEVLWLVKLTAEDYSFLTEMESLKTVKIWDITLGDEIIKELQDKGVDVVKA